MSESIDIIQRIFAYGKTLKDERVSIADLTGASIQQAASVIDDFLSDKVDIALIRVTKKNQMFLKTHLSEKVSNPMSVSLFPIGATVCRTKNQRIVTLTDDMSLARLRGIFFPQPFGACPICRATTAQISIEK